jgi:hypothetical protein
MQSQITSVAMETIEYHQMNVSRLSDNNGHDGAKREQNNAHSVEIRQMLSAKSGEITGTEAEINARRTTH